MGWLADLVGWVPAKERRGIEVDARRTHWELECPHDLASLFLALDGWLPEGSFVYLEDYVPSAEIEAFFRANAVPERVHLAMGTIWPRPRVVHLPASSTVLTRLADMAERYATVYIAIHLHAYCGDEVLVQGYDILAQELWLPPTLSEARVAELAERLGVKYRREA
jgi:hypothetical protein